MQYMYNKINTQVLLPLPETVTRYDVEMSLFWKHELSNEENKSK